MIYLFFFLQGLTEKTQDGDLHKHNFKVKKHILKSAQSKLFTTLFYE